MVRPGETPSNISSLGRDRPSHLMALSTERPIRSHRQVSVVDFVVPVLPPPWFRGRYCQPKVPHIVNRTSNAHSNIEPIADCLSTWPVLRSSPFSLLYTTTSIINQSINHIQPLISLISNIPSTSSHQSHSPPSKFPFLSLAVPRKGITVLDHLQQLYHPESRADCRADNNPTIRDNVRSRTGPRRPPRRPSRQSEQFGLLRLDARDARTRLRVPVCHVALLADLGSGRGSGSRLAASGGTSGC